MMLVARERVGRKADVAVFSKTRTKPPGGGGYRLRLLLELLPQGRATQHWRRLCHPEHAIMEQLSYQSQDIKDRLINPRPTLRGSQFVTIINAYAFPMSSLTEANNKYYKDLQAILASAPKAGKLIVGRIPVGSPPG
ncbi:hypothetical protein SprV_0200743000 [Sparganum proliferum]